METLLVLHIKQLCKPNWFAVGLKERDGEYLAYDKLEGYSNCKWHYKNSRMVKKEKWSKQERHIVDRGMERGM